MKKFAMLILATALIAAACNKVSDNTTPPPPTPNPTEVPPPTGGLPTLQTYTNATYGFQFQYPPQYSFVTPQYANLQDKITEIRIPATDYPKTNLVDAAFSVSTSSANTLASCLSQNAPENGDGFKTKTTINGVDFYMTKSAGAAAGNRYDSTFYRAWMGNKACVEIGETVHTGAIGNYPAGTVTEVDPASIQSSFDLMRNSFKFNQ